AGIDRARQDCRPVRRRRQSARAHRRRARCASGDESRRAVRPEGAAPVGRRKDRPHRSERSHALATSAVGGHMQMLRGLVVAIILLATPSTVLAQTDGTVHGIVADESRAVLPGATLTLTDLNTGRQYTAVSDVRGDYRLVNVAAGTYKLQAELSGFA